jgi:exopolysaccharide biosynthesis polyprenyl glycosylphosphotransferase
MNIRAGRLPHTANALPYPRAASLSLRTQRTILRIILTLTDALVLGAAFRVAFWFRFDLQWTLAPEVVPNPAFYPMLAAVLVPTWILVFTLFDLYDPHHILGGVTEYSRIFNACTTGTMLLIIATFIEPTFIVSRMWVISAWVVSVVLISANRFVLRRVVYYLRERGFLLVPTAIVGTNEEAHTLAGDLAEWRVSGLRIIGFVSTGDESNQAESGGHPILGSVEEIVDIVNTHGVEDLVVAITALRRDQLLSLCEEVNETPEVQLRLSSGLYELLTTGVKVKTLGTVPLVSLNKIRLEPQEVWIKTVLEYCLSAMGLLLLSPMIIMLSILIKIDSPGPVFHRRRVLGVSGKQFDAFKFRTMHINGDEILSSDPELSARLEDDHKLKDDPRITRVGKWLRKYSLDELPQLLNVLAGQMGLVGPRMISPAEAEKYGRMKMNLLTVKPGITGLWQVSGRSDLSYEDRVRLDMYYIRNYSVWLDLQILFVQTIPAVVKGKGAY